MKENRWSKPNQITFNCLLNACVKCQSLDKATEIFAEMTSTHIRPDLITYSTLIKGYCRGGDIARAHELFMAMIDSRITPDTAVINLFLENCFTSKKDYSSEGIELFEMLQNSRIQPNQVTFSILVKLYGRARKLGKALGVLGVMKSYYVRPGLIVFTNLVQVCFNAKRAEKAVEMYEEMLGRRIKGD